jgi:hypothetical protein
MTLPDDAFFELMRSSLGAIKTPFNKQKLLEDLSSFVSRPEIQKTMAAYINGNDRRIIAAVALLGEPVPGELESFFSGDFSYAELQGMLLNLEERLILYRFREGDTLRLALNPRLEGILAPIAAARGELFSSSELPEAAEFPSGPPPVDSRVLAALFAFLFKGVPLLRGDPREAGEERPDLSFRKKALDEGSRLFPSLDLEALTGGILCLGLFVPEGEYLVPEEAKLAAFRSLSEGDRLEYLAAGIALFLVRGFSVCPARSILKSTVRLIHLILQSAAAPEEKRVLSESTIIKLAEILRRTEEKGWGFMGAGSSSGGIPPAPVLCRSLVLAGLFSVHPAEGKNYYLPVQRREAKAGGDQIPLAMDSGLSFILYPEIDFTDALDLAAFSSVEETGAAVRFTLSRESAVKGFDRGYTAEFMWRLLERLSGGRSGGALRWNLEDWEKRWKEVSLSSGTVLVLGGERAYLAQTGALAGLIKETLGPGIYLLSVDTGEAAAALRNAGVDIVARPQEKARRETVSPAFPPLADLSPPVLSVPVPPPASPQEKRQDPGAEESAAEIQETFRGFLRGMKLTRQEQDELEARIERRVVVSEGQLKDTTLRYEKLEARSLDYVGKAGVARQALASGSLLEVNFIIVGSSGQNTILGIPEGLEKKGADMILTVKPREGGESLRIPLGKISLLRRIKQSIFGE